MTFLKLSSLVINTSKITFVKVLEKKYQINMVSSTLEGAFLVGIGRIDSSTTMIEVCKEKHTGDFDTVTRWIDSKSTF